MGGGTWSPPPDVGVHQVPPYTWGHGKAARQEGPGGRWTVTVRATVRPGTCLWYASRTLRVQAVWMGVPGPT